MPDSQPLNLAIAGDGFILSRVDANGVRTEMALSEAEVISLIHNARLEIDRLLEQRRRGSIGPRMTIGVREAVVNTNLHKTTLGLTLIDFEGREFSFAIQVDTARAMAAALPRRVAELRDPPPASETH